MDGWMDELADGWMDECLAGQIYGCTKTWSRHRGHVIAFKNLDSKILPAKKLQFKFISTFRSTFYFYFILIFFPLFNAFLFLSLILNQKRSKRKSGLFLLFLVFQIGCFQEKMITTHIHDHRHLGIIVVKL